MKSAKFLFLFLGWLTIFSNMVFSQTWDLEDYSSYTTGPSYAGYNYPAHWMSPEKYPCFSWEVIPQYSTFKSGKTLPDTTYKMAAEHPLVDVNGSSFGYATWDEGMWAANAKLKSYNPTVKGSFYMNSEIIFPSYLHTDKIFSHPERIDPDRKIRNFSVYYQENAELRKFWVNNILNGLRNENVDFAFIDKTSGLGIIYNEAGEVTDPKNQMIELLYKSLPADKFLIGNTLRNESGGGNRSAMQIYDGSYLERWSGPNRNYPSQTEAEASAVTIQLMREALTKGKIIMLRNTDRAYNKTGELNARFYVPLAGFLIAVEKNGFISYQGFNLAYKENIWYTRDLEYLSNYLGSTLVPPVKNGLKYSRSFENLDVTLDLSAGDDLVSAIATFKWKGMSRPQPLYDHKSGTFLAQTSVTDHVTAVGNGFRLVEIFSEI